MISLVPKCKKISIVFTEWVLHFFKYTDQVFNVFSKGFLNRWDLFVMYRLSYVICAVEILSLLLLIQVLLSSSVEELRHFPLVLLHHRPFNHLVLLFVVVI